MPPYLHEGLYQGFLVTRFVVSSFEPVKCYATALGVCGVDVNLTSKVA